MEVLSVNISEKKGTIKKPVPQIELDSRGVRGDAHAGDWHRQVSLLAEESIIKFSQQAGRKINYGEFAENITTRGIEVWQTHPLDRFQIGEVELEVTQIGKECHGSSCAIFNEVGNCVMPKEGIFTRVIRPGIVKAGDTLQYLPYTFDVQIITLSDRASRGEYEDLSGPRIAELAGSYFEELGWQCNIDVTVIPDDAAQLQLLLEGFVESGADFIFTTGGTGIGPRDITVDVIKPMLDKELPGIMELIRYKYGSLKPNALLSRSVAGVTGGTLIYTLPGSVKAVNEYCSEIFPTLKHSILMLHGIDSH
ncbi:MAG TPA: molybdopterin-binding protein [Bacteroidales bacterium]|nr:molybdopterin-binding protein [Bacteroidales bacterium]